MAYVPDFKHDVFVSYASDDYDGHMAQFVAGLRVYLAQELGKLFAEDGLFFDRQDLNKSPLEWKRRLEQSAGSAAILVPLLSESYATSPWCAKELEWFCDEGHDHPLRWESGREEIYRICPMLWRPLDTLTERQLAREVREAQAQRSTGVEDLGKKIANGLRLMRRSFKKVYVGETDNKVREEVQDELSRIGFRVMPESPMAFRDEELVREFLSEARMSVHFVDGQAQQRAIDAIGWSRRDCQGATVVYEVPGHDLSDEERVSLEWIEGDLKPASAAGARAYDRVSGKNLLQFLQILEDRLAGERRVSPTRLGIACEESDRRAVEAIIPEITTHTGFSVTCHGLSILNFKKSRGVLFYWGAGEGKQLQQARRVVPLRAFFLAPPPKAPGHEEELREESVLRQQGDHFRVADIGPFLRQLGWAG